MSTSIETFPVDAVSAAVEELFGDIDDLARDWRAVLQCDEVDEDLFESSLPEDRAQALFARTVKTVYLEPFSHCNRGCGHCPVSMMNYRAANNRYIDDDVFRAVIRDLAAIAYDQSLSLSLYNEPTADRRIFTYIRHARRHLPAADISFHSNGDFLTSETLGEFADCGLDRMHITRHLPKNKPYVDEERMAELTRYYRRLGRRLAVDRHVPDRFITSHFHVDGLRVNVETRDFGRSGALRSDSVAPLVRSETRHWPCIRPFREFTVFHDAYCYPCGNVFSSLDRKRRFAVGKVADFDSIYQAYCSPALASYRKHLFGYGAKAPPCDQCTEPFLHARRAGRC